VSKELREIVVFAALGAAVIAGLFLLIGISDDSFWVPGRRHPGGGYVRDLVYQRAAIGGAVGGGIGALVAIARNMLKRDK
jgi:hypothetical protein